MKKQILDPKVENKIISTELEQEINEKIIILHGNNDQVLLPLYLWNKIIRQFYITQIESK